MKAKRLNLRLVMSATLLGNTLEWYDYAAYAFLIPIFTEIFFVSADPHIAVIKALMVFGFGTISRPLGGLIFGNIGDRWGRKTALICSILLMAVPVLGIGILPTYAQIGLAAPIIMACLRFIQGIATGGEFPGVIVYLVESSPRNRREFFGSFVFLGIVLGLLFGTVEYLLLFLNFSEKADYTWGWRISFLFGFLLATSTLYLRHKLHETPLYEKTKSDLSIRRDPLKEVFKRHKKALGLIIGIDLLPNIAFKITVLFQIVYLHHYLLVSFKTSLLLNLALLLFLLVCLPIMGKAITRFGCRPIALFGAWGFLIFSYPLYALLNSPLLTSKVLALFMLGILWASHSAPLPAIFCDVFPTPIRFSGIGIAYNLSAGLIGGLLPAFTFYLIKKLDNLLPAFLLMALALISIFSLIQLKKQRFYLTT